MTQRKKDGSHEGTSVNVPTTLAKGQRETDEMERDVRE